MINPSVFQPPAFKNAYFMRYVGNVSTMLLGETAEFFLIIDHTKPNLKKHPNPSEYSITLTAELPLNYDLQQADLSITYYRCEYHVNEGVDEELEWEFLEWALTELIHDHGVIYFTIYDDDAFNHFKTIYTEDRRKHLGLIFGAMNNLNDKYVFDNNFGVAESAVDWNWVIHYKFMKDTVAEMLEMEMLHRDQDLRQKINEIDDIMLQTNGNARINWKNRTGEFRNSPADPWQITDRLGKLPKQLKKHLSKDKIARLIDLMNGVVSKLQRTEAAMGITEITKSRIKFMEALLWRTKDSTNNYFMKQFNTEIPLNEDYYVRLSDSEFDLFRKSTGQLWQEVSCERWWGCCRWGFQSDIQDGNMVAFIHSQHTKKAVGRLMLRWCYIKNRTQQEASVGFEPIWYMANLQDMWQNLPPLTPEIKAKHSKLWPTSINGIKVSGKGGGFVRDHLLPLSNGEFLSSWFVEDKIMDYLEEKGMNNAFTECETVTEYGGYSDQNHVIRGESSGPIVYFGAPRARKTFAKKVNILAHCPACNAALIWESPHSKEDFKQVARESPEAHYLEIDGLKFNYYGISFQSRRTIINHFDNCSVCGRTFGVLSGDEIQTYPEKKLPRILKTVDTNGNPIHLAALMAYLPLYAEKIWNIDIGDQSQGQCPNCNAHIHQNVGGISIPMVFKLKHVFHTIDPFSPAEFQCILCNTALQKQGVTFIQKQSFIESYYSSLFVGT